MVEIHDGHESTISVEWQDRGMMMIMTIIYNKSIFLKTRPIEDDFCDFTNSRSNRMVESDTVSAGATEKESMDT